MALRINNNISSINGQRNLVKNDQMLARSLEKLSSGLKINRAADNAAGLVISEQMRAQIKGLAQATSNSETAVNMVQTAEGALDEVSSLLTKARELVLHAANEGANDTNQLAADQGEMDNVIKAVTRISEQTQFGTKKLLDGSLNGATAISDTSKLARVKVGNLANNSAISAGTVTLAVTAGTKESQLLKKSGTSTDSYAFSAAVTGVKMGTAKLVSGATATLNINGSAYTITATGGGATATQVAAKLQTAVTAGIGGFNVSADSNGQIKVERTGLGATDFTSSVTFAKTATAAVAGTKEAITATLKSTAPGNGSGAAAILFGGTVAKLSGVATTSVLTKSGTIFTAKISTATGGGFSVTYTTSGASGTRTMSTILSKLQSGIRTNGGSAARKLTGATVSLAAGVASGFAVKIERGANAAATDLNDFSFTLEVDHNNVATTKSEVHTIAVSTLTVKTGLVTNGATFRSGAATTSGIAATAITGSTILVSGRAISLTVNGVTKTLTGKRTLTALAAAFQTAFSTAPGLTGIKVAFVTGGKLASGLAGQVGATGTLGANKGFAVYNSDGTDLSVSLSIDQYSGLDVNAAGTQFLNGQKAVATLNLDTTAQTRTSGTLSNSGKAASSISSTSTASTVTSGSAVTATMTTADGSVISVKSSAIVSGSSITLSLTTGSTAAGYQGVTLEISNAYAIAGGSTSFKLNNGAEFQIGANAGQKAGLTIDNIKATELGRNVTGAGTLTSLNDLLSTNKSALTSGLTTEALKVIDASIDEVTNARGKMGAFQANTLESTLNSLRVSSENLTAAESVIRDTDFAAESARFTRNQILTQASQSMLAQANQLPQSVLQLLGR